MNRRTLRAIPLGATRLELHGAALALGSVADAILDAQPDDSQSNLGALVGSRPASLALERGTRN